MVAEYIRFKFPDEIESPATVATVATLQKDQPETVASVADVAEAEPDAETVGPAEADLLDIDIEDRFAAYEERAAFLEYHCGLPREEAERQAAVENGFDALPELDAILNDHRNIPTIRPK